MAFAFQGARGAESTAYAATVEEPGSGDARFDALFTGLEAQLDATSAADDDLAVEEIARAAWSEVALLDRLRAAATSQSGVVVEVAHHGAVSGEIAEVGRDVVLLQSNDGDWAIPAWGIAAVIGAADGSAPAEGVAGRLGFAAVARRWSQERSVVRIFRTGGVPLDGTIDRVGADHLDLAEHDPGVPRLPSEVRRSLAVPLAAITAMRRR